MLNYIWVGMLIAGIITGIINGRIDEVTKAILESSQSAIELSIGLLGVMCLWTGLMGVAEKSGIIKVIAKVLNPVIKFLFPEIPKNHPATGAIVMNLVANFLGLGNAATPLGIKAMKELQKLNRHKDTSTDAMSTFLVLNTCCVQFIPATIVAVRVAAGSANPTEVIGTIWIATILATVAGVTAVKIFSVVCRNSSFSQS
ncbi:nucleoside recognition domain-containing protein [Herbivorax sp. ANBcel31]|uniref:nucleoside recognition domain-containing protein n=1 Tax=Herbivorax sp. ANBcel31 TaxID=3069754 RepID=UPI0027B4C0BF|nr:nucleoside recognition domain-containing protein [Herbivorax sp. ANBcel31]MDQ2086363.1 nucleoside recognition domain-containing protein [Herbivorax sp. ANBcel31]